MIVSYIQISRLNVEPMTVEVLSCLSSSPQTLYTADSYGGTSLFWATKPPSTEAVQKLALFAALHQL